MKIRSLFILALSLALASCSKHQFSQFDRFGEENRWPQNEAKTFGFEITDDSQQYDIVLRFSHVYGYQFPTVPLSFSIEDPKGHKENLSVNLRLKGKDGRELGDCAGDICDLDYPIKSQARLLKGNYKITVSHNFKAAPYLPNVIGIGLNVDSAK